GNYVGTDATGSFAVPNGDGMDILDASNNTVGGATPEARNVVSGNLYQGIYISGFNDLSATSTTGNLVQGNYVGTNGDGTAAIRSDTLIAGININDASYTHVDGNVVSGNGGLGNARGQNGVGVAITQFFGTAQYNTVTNNKIGTSADGTAAIPNVSGIGIFGGTQHNTVAGNLISGNVWEGVQIFPDVLPEPTPTSDNVIRNNIITNNSDGVEIGGGAGYTIEYDGTSFITSSTPTHGTNNNF